MAARAASRVPQPLWAVGAFAATRALLLLWVLGALPFPGLDVTGDVSVIYHGWYEVLRTGRFPGSDVTWQYPPGAALAVLSPALLPFLAYARAFFAVLFAADALVLGMLLYAARRPGRSARGAWVWVAGVPLLGPTAYARYDLLATAVAVAALLAGVRRPRVLGALAAFGALLKVWPVLVLAGTRRGRATVRSWGTAALVGAGLLLTAWAALPGALAFLRFQQARGTEVESLGALVLHAARHLGWPGEVALHYGSVEFLGPHVQLVSGVAQVLSGLALGWLLLWRRLAGTWPPGTLADAAFTAVLLFTTTSRVISPQYMVWLVGLAAVCLLRRTGPMRAPALMVLAATLVTTLEFPVWFGHVVAGDALGITLLCVRNGLLVAASVTAGVLLWRRTVRPPRHRADSPECVRGTEELVDSH
ncbi:glycosyltransferase family 87 protein [Streptomyces sulfonofaciens]|nr:glycosyltransferase family 87 protein [Streptomyces sulfonofaciens]